MYTIYQGDSSDIIKVNMSVDISDELWEGELVVVNSLTNLRPLIKKSFDKDLNTNSFYTFLSPTETHKLRPGMYILAWQIRNESLNFSKEYQDKLRVKNQVIFSSLSTSGTSAMPPSGGFIDVNTINIFDTNKF